jgi:hypothetical protein
MLQTGNIGGSTHGFLCVWILLLFVGSVSAQNTFKGIWPLDSPFVITGNYGELRPNHFHTGLDFSTGGRMNLPVYSVEEGYVSRVRVGPGGYGKCVYITHPQGKVSVYAHLNSFSLKIDKIVREQQIAMQNYEVEVLPRPRTVYVRKNEIIGLSGNTGSSTGPHLHFEIRDEITEVPLNPLEYYKIFDVTKPELEYIGFYDLADTTAPRFLNSYRVKEIGKDSLCLERDHIVLDQAIVGLAYSGFDRFTTNGSYNNIFSSRVYFDDFLVYSHRLSGIAFPDSRYINEFSETIGKTKYQKCFLPTLYPSGLYYDCFDKGRIFLTNSNFHKIRLVVSDECGNERRLQFYVRAKQFNYYREPSLKSDVLVNCTEDLRIGKNDLSIYIPAGSLYYSTPLVIESTLETNGKFRILPSVNLKQPVTVGFKVPAKWLRNREKLLLAYGSQLSTPLNRNDSVFFPVKSFDAYQLVVDTVPPKVRVDYSAKKLKEAWKMDSFSFLISDNLSGIAKYNLWLNNTWVIAEYDAKADLLTYYFDEETPIGLLNF